MRFYSIASQRIYELMKFSGEKALATRWMLPHVDLSTALEQDFTKNFHICICCAPPKNTAAELRLWLVNTIFQQFSRAPRITYVSSAKVVKFSAEGILYMACISRTTKPRANIFYLILIKSFSVCVFAICTLFKSEMIFFL